MRSDKGHQTRTKLAPVGYPQKITFGFHLENVVYVKKFQTSCLESTKIICVLFFIKKFCTAYHS